MAVKSAGGLGCARSGGASYGFTGLLLVSNRVLGPNRIFGWKNRIFGWNHIHWWGHNGLIWSYNRVFPEKKSLFLTFFFWLNSLEHHTQKQNVLVSGCVINTIRNQLKPKWQMVAIWVNQHPIGGENVRTRCFSSWNDPSTTTTRVLSFVTRTCLILFVTCTSFSL